MNDSDELCDALIPWPHPPAEHEMIHPDLCYCHGRLGHDGKHYCCCDREWR